jgi:hypothetical protein
MIPRLFLVAFSIAQPFLIQDAIDFVENGNEPDRHGYGLIGAFGITYLGIAVRLYPPPPPSVPNEQTGLTFTSGFDGVVSVSDFPGAFNDSRGSDQRHL